MTSLNAARLGPGLAGVLALIAAGSVLVLEIAAGRMLAPYVGVSLTTYSGIIGVILAGIAIGAWAGGRAADLYGPVELLGPTFMLGGLTAMASVPIVDVVGSLGLGTGVGAIVVLATVGFVLPAATLSAVAPMVVRATIVDVATSGSLVGRLSAAGTIGAISGTFLTGFVLLGAVPTRLIIFVTGALLVLLGLGLAVRARRRSQAADRDPDDSGPGTGVTVLTVAIGLLVVGGATLAAPRPCERESAYFCIRVVEDATNASGRTLVLDQLRHAYVDLENPNHLEFAYIRWFDAAVADIFETKDGDVDALYVGGGGFSFPRHLADAWPASRHTVLELDPVVYDIALTELGLVPSASLQVTLGDARTSVQALADDAYDVVIGDAFGSLSVPWHLTTHEFLGEIDRVLRPDGRYVMNLIDGPALSFVRAEVRTLQAGFEHVAVVARPGAFDGLDGGSGGGGNVVLVASHTPVDVPAIAARLEQTGGGRVRTIRGGTNLASFVGDAPFLTDDLAPVDQLIGR